MVAISIAAKFVEQLDRTDRDLVWLRYVDAEDGGVQLCESSREILGRFGMDPGAWQDGPPDERQIRNLLRRMAGAEAAERGAERRDST
jgi:hypothetical protein